MAGTQDQLEYRRSGIRAVQSTPLRSRSGRPLGMLSTHWRTPHTPTEEDFTFFDVLARLAADLIEPFGFVWDDLWHLGFLLGFGLAMWRLAINRMEKRLID